MGLLHSPREWESLREESDEGEPQEETDEESQEEPPEHQSTRRLPAQG